MKRHEFWTEVFAWHGSVTPHVVARVAFFGVVSIVIWMAASWMAVDTGLGVAPYEIVGAILALLLVLRTNAGYDRWYEARKLWGGIVNQSRNLALTGLTYGPQDAEWRSSLVRWTASFSHTARHSLRDERRLDDMLTLLGPDVSQIARAGHMPSYVAMRLAEILRRAVDHGQLSEFAFLQADRERALLIDHIGACERILKTPLARPFSIKIRRFLFLYLMALPCGIVDKSGALTPLLTMMVAYPLLSLDQIGVELQSPFDPKRLGNLPLSDICRGIERDLLAMLDAPPGGRLPAARAPAWDDELAGNGNEKDPQREMALSAPGSPRND